MQKTIVWSTVYSKDVKFKTPCRPLFILATILSANKGLKVLSYEFDIPGPWHKTSLS